MTINQSMNMKVMRWRILLSLHSARPGCLSEHIISEMVNDDSITIDRNKVRSAYQYLCDKGFVSIDIDDTDDIWCARLKSDGVDFVEYTNKNSHSGIARPLKNFNS